jgi:hypothetical protein
MANVSAFNLLSWFASAFKASLKLGIWNLIAFTLSVGHSHLVSDKGFGVREVTYCFKMLQRDVDPANVVYIFCNVPK